MEWIGKKYADELQHVRPLRVAWFPTGNLHCGYIPTLNQISDFINLGYKVTIYSIDPFIARYLIRVLKVTDFTLGTTKKTMEYYEFMESAERVTSLQKAKSINRNVTWIHDLVEPNRLAITEYLTKADVILGRLEDKPRYMYARALYDSMQIHGPAICMISLTSDGDRLPLSSLCSRDLVLKYSADMLLSFQFLPENVKKKYLEGYYTESDVRTAFYTSLNLVNRMLQDPPIRTM